MNPTEIEEYLFDLRGYLVLRQVIDSNHVNELNNILENFLDMEPDEWRGWVHHRDTAPQKNSIEIGQNRDVRSKHHIHNIFEMGEPYEKLIDCPGWIDYINRFVGGDDGLFIDESFVDIRGPNAGTRLHGGAGKRRIRTQFRYHNNQFRCGQVNVLLALTNIGLGDGATMAVPGSHKSNLIHPQDSKSRKNSLAPGYESLDGVIGAEEIYLDSGDALVFVDCMAHGSARRRKKGERRIAIIRYGPKWGNDRYGYRPSPDLLDRLKPECKKILQPVPPSIPPEAKVEMENH